MSIISLAFLGFLAAVFILYFVLPRPCQPYVLLAAGICFFLTFGLSGFLVFLAGAAVTYGFARLIARAGTQKSKKLLLGSAVVLLAGTLVTVKFFNYVFSLILPAFVPVSFLVPIGIAFYTMQEISYLVDVYRGKYEAEKNPVRVLLYLCYFPVILQGPICRWQPLAGELFAPHAFSFDRMSAGVSRMVFGFFKKLVIADRAALFVNTVFGNYTEYRGFEIILAVVLYSLQIYADFSGCVDISLGFSEVLGIPLPENFDHPYFASSIRDFWRRWHQSLSFWFRDYIYIPLGGNRKGKARKYLNLTAVFFVSGLWHGVGFHYLVWGLMQAFFQVLGEITHPWREKLYDACGVKKEAASFRFGQRLFTFFLVNLSWLFFRADGFRAALSMLKSALLGLDPWAFSDGTLLALGLDGRDWNVLILSAALLLLISLFQEKRGRVWTFLKEQNIWFRYGAALLFILFVVVFGIYGPGYSEAQFLYMQF